MKPSTNNTAWLGSDAIRTTYLDRMKQHAALDEIIQGTYWKNRKGCALGCLIESESPYETLESETGIPNTIGYLSDAIFEGLPNDEAKQWALAFPTSIATGADLSLVIPRFMVWLLIDPDKGVRQWADGQCKAAIDQVAGLYQRLIDGGTVAYAELAAASAAARAAWAARAARAASAAWAASAASAAWAARAARAASDAWPASDAWAASDAAWAARAAARAASDAWPASDAWAASDAAWAARAAARADHYRAMRDKLKELLTSAPVVAEVTA